MKSFYLRLNLPYEILVRSDGKRKWKNDEWKTADEWKQWQQYKTENKSRWDFSLNNFSKLKQHIFPYAHLHM